MNFSGPMWHRPGQESVLLASGRYDGSTSRKTKGSMADTLQCNLWRRALTPHRMTHRLHGGDNHGKFNGFTALGKTIGTRKSTLRDSEYVEEHSVLKYLRGKLACYLHDFRRHWFLVASSCLPRMGGTRQGVQARAASCTTSTRGPCAGPPTTPRSP